MRLGTTRSRAFTTVSVMPPQQSRMRSLLLKKPTSKNGKAAIIVRALATPSSSCERYIIGVVSNARCAASPAANPRQSATKSAYKDIYQSILVWAAIRIETCHTGYRKRPHQHIAHCVEDHAQGHRTPYPRKVSVTSVAHIAWAGSIKTLQLITSIMLAQCESDVGAYQL